MEEKYLPELMAEKDSLDPSFTHALRLVSQGEARAGRPFAVARGRWGPLGAGREPAERRAARRRAGGGWTETSGSLGGTKGAVWGHLGGLGEEATPGETRRVHLGDQGGKEEGAGRLDGTRWESGSPGYPGETSAWWTADIWGLWRGGRGCNYLFVEESVGDSEN